jgi:hypothetical protein
VDAPYLAIVAKVDAAPGVDVGQEYQFRVVELSGTLGVDTLIHAAPGDTIILPVQPATYLVTASGVPPQCGIQQGAERGIVVPPNSNTSVVRYLIICAAGLTVTTNSDGAPIDDAMVLSVEGPTVLRQELVAANDTVRLSGLPAGDYQVSLRLLQSNCTVTSDGGANPIVAVDSVGGAVANFRIVCSDEALRPRMLSMVTSYHGGASGFVAVVTDAGRDIERYVWDITDCRGTSVLAHGARTRRGLSGGRTAQQDTVTIVGAFEVGRPDVEMVGRCTSLRFVDQLGNTTPVVEEPIGNEGGRAPVASRFNATLLGQASLPIDLAISDPDGDLAGLFVGVRMRDGVLGPVDGEEDFGVYNVAGYLDVSELPTLTFSAGRRPAWDDIFAVVVYLLDGRGNLTRLEDGDLFQ